MSLIVNNTNYSGEVLETLLTKAATGNQLVQRGLIRLEPNVGPKGLSIPRIKTGTMLRKRKEQPTDADSKGNFGYSERALKPVDFMAFTTFNPRSFEQVWRAFQPKGDLIFSQLPPNVQNTLLAELSKQVNFELGGHFVNGIYIDDEEDDKHLFNGILSRILSDNEVIYVNTSETTMINKLKAVRQATPEILRSNPNFKYLMSINDADKYDDELTAQANKGANWTDTNSMRFKGTTIEALAAMPDGLIVGVVATMDMDTNLWGAVNLQDDYNVVQIEKITAAGERYFFKMLMTADTNTAFGEEIVVLDTRVALADATLAGTVITAPEYVTEIAITPTADTTYSITGDGLLLGARIRIMNSDDVFKITIGTIVIEPGKTADLYYTGVATAPWYAGRIY